MVQGLSMVTLHWLDNFFFQVPPHYTSQPLHIDRACRRVASQYSWGHILLISRSTLPLSCIFKTPFYGAFPKTQHSLWSLGFFLTWTAFVVFVSFFFLATLIWLQPLLAADQSDLKWLDAISVSRLLWGCKGDRIVNYVWISHSKLSPRMCSFITFAYRSLQRSASQSTVWPQ